MPKTPANRHPAVITTEVRDFAAKAAQQMLGGFDGPTDSDIREAAETLYHAMLRLCNRIAWEAKDQAIFDFTAGKPETEPSRLLPSSTDTVR